jgi:hypothetical protein
MSTAGHRHQLLLYTYVLNRWWRTTLGIGIVMLILAFGLTYLPRLLPGVVTYAVPEVGPWAVGGGGAFTIFLSLFIIAIRKSAYVQPFGNHLRLATPFLRLKISYRRIRQSSSMEMKRLFSPALVRRKYRTLNPLSKFTFIVLDLNGLPLPRPALHLFLSPLFFPDKTPRLALLVPDWMKFSTELESFRSAWMDSQRQPGRDPRMALLSDITKRRR